LQVDALEAVIDATDVRRGARASLWKLAEAAGVRAGEQTLARRKLCVVAYGADSLSDEVRLVVLDEVIAAQREHMGVIAR
jgi:hypothetical protein